MEALHFGPSTRPLLGLRHEPVGIPRDIAWVLCPPWGPEYMRSQRGLRHLAQRLAAAGFDTLRFDYSGTGDSEGHTLHARVEHWIADIGHAVRELRDISGTSRIGFIGLRLGALLAAEASARGLACHAQVLWDTPENGASFARLMQQHDHALDARKNRYRARNNQLPPHGDDECCGYAWHEELASAISTLPAPAAHPRQLWVRSADHREPLPPHAGTPWVAEEESRWQQASWIYSPWLPARSMTALVEHLKTWPK